MRDSDPDDISIDPRVETERQLAFPFYGRQIERVGRVFRPTLQTTEGHWPLFYRNAEQITIIGGMNGIVPSDRL